MESLDKPVFLQDVDRIIGEVNRIKKYRGSFIADMPELDIPPEIDEQHKRLEELYHKVVHNNKISD